MVHDKQQYGEGLARSVRENLNKAGVKEVMFEGVTAGDKDFSALVAKLKKENVDFVYFGGYYPEMGQILRQAKQSGLNIRFMELMKVLVTRHYRISLVMLRKGC